jgi:Transposase
VTVNLKGQVCLVLGVDWAESFHDVAIGRPGEGVIDQFRIDHGPAGVQRLVARCLDLEPDPAEVRVVLETRHGLLAGALADAGFTVLAVNPDLVARRRGPAKKKDDAEDARICCLLALDQYTGLRKLIPHGELGAELRAIARDDERAARDERRIGNRLRADLLAVFPAALGIAAGDLGAPVFLQLLERWPSAEVLAATSREEIEAFARSARRGWPGRFADQVTAALAESQLAAVPSWPAPRSARSGWPPPSCCPCVISARPGNGGWVNCCSAPPAPARTRLPRTQTRGRRSRAARST